MEEIQKIFQLLTITSLIFSCKWSIYIFHNFLLLLEWSWFLYKKIGIRYWNIKINSILRLSLVIFIIFLSGGILPLYLILPLLLLTSFLPTKDISKDFKISKYGDLSYGIYLIHFPIIRLLSISPIFNNLPDNFLIFLVVSLSVIGAFILYWKVERRFLEKNSYYYKLVSWLSLLKLLFIF